MCLVGSSVPGNTGEIGVGAADTAVTEIETGGVPHELLVGYPHSLRHKVIKAKNVQNHRIKAHRRFGREKAEKAAKASALENTKTE